MKEEILSQFEDAEEVLKRFISELDNIAVMEKLALLLAETFRRGNKVIIFGNGGSMCDAMHFAEELTGKFGTERIPLPAIALSDPAYLTCVANDYGYEEVFARGVQALAKPDDVVIGLSTSGNSVNVINALKRAQSLNCITVALLGKDGGRLKGECDYEMIIGSNSTERIQEMQMQILHILIGETEKQLFPNLFADNQLSDKEE